MTTTTPFQRFAIALASGTVLVAGLSACVPLVVGGAAAVGVGMVATDRRSSGAQLDDQGIELRAAARVREIANDNMYVSVTSFNRQVLLTGAVGSDADRRRVEDLVQRVDNVRSVVNELTVGPPSTFQDRSNDLFISGKVKASLLDAKDIFANSFKVVTERGVVYLMGIATRRETDRATEIARGISGVQKVVRVVEVVSEAELASQAQQAQRGGTGSPAPAPAPSSAPGSSSSSSRVPLPPMEPLPPAQPGGATATPVR
ncbi:MULTISPECIES: BON domain-containing protein [Variovorax]|jgi:osmotically-inducible protein OsmY|uniref:Osmotically-inducible protein OsmY n=2 Tax=Variovorax paradoxus TaxID=34073 RepID=A0AAW8EJ51_VARPD|nr:BON domain-containing protein [Variovorax paradoxus]MBW8716127.1 BON domain-containing protein [Variovorax paradoxus]MBW8890934.1 BON domain-containing protein [Burkholderiales bacterium]MDP9973038.1 osmotically-inducible protein OsmY [Variovorax paradoxus]